MFPNVPSIPQHSQRSQHWAGGRQSADGHGRDVSRVSHQHQSGILENLESFKSDPGSRPLWLFQG